jgi:hypothetical protein
VDGLAQCAETVLRKRASAERQKQNRRNEPPPFAEKADRNAYTPVPVRKCARARVRAWSLT